MKMLKMMKYDYKKDGTSQKVMQKMKHEET